MGRGREKTGDGRRRINRRCVWMAWVAAEQVGTRRQPVSARDLSPHGDASRGPLPCSWASKFALQRRENVSQGRPSPPMQVARLAAGTSAPWLSSTSRCGRVVLGCRSLVGGCNLRAAGTLVWSLLGQFTPSPDIASGTNCVAQQRGDWTRARPARVGGLLCSSAPLLSRIRFADADANRQPRTRRRQRTHATPSRQIGRKNRGRAHRTGGGEGTARGSKCEKSLIPRHFLRVDCTGEGTTHME